MGLAARKTKILPTRGMSWHWQIEKCTHYERKKDGVKEGEGGAVRKFANSPKSNSSTIEKL